MRWQVIPGLLQPRLFQQQRGQSFADFRAAVQRKLQVAATG
ncbi:MAG: hypothetical protein WKG07_32820 [Hymenobacter sp.]